MRLPSTAIVKAKLDHSVRGRVSVTLTELRLKVIFTPLKKYRYSLARPINLLRLLQLMT